MCIRGTVVETKGCAFALEELDAVVRKNDAKHREDFE
jgi:hypothetical protein